MNYPYIHPCTELRSGVGSVYVFLNEGHPARAVDETCQIGSVLIASLVVVFESLSEILAIFLSVCKFATCNISNVLSKEIWQHQFELLLRIFANSRLDMLGKNRKTPEG